MMMMMTTATMMKMIVMECLISTTQDMGRLVQTPTQQTQRVCTGQLQCPSVMEVVKVVVVLLLIMTIMVMVMEVVVMAMMMMVEVW